ncbi:MAG TPA: NAD(P)-dependent oxidoreductase [Tepidisphaeraceae bacterium]|nr:NAD(P)-dependent oxidoreductase [Tepidisphaeraceae bacterium]
MAHAYPIQLDVTDRLIVIVGGGLVAVRKAAGLAAAGATRVRCVSPTFHAQLPGYVERVTATYDPQHLDGASLAFAATDSMAVNDAVTRDARQRGILVGRADRSDDAGGNPGDFTVPAVHRAGSITLTVAAGASPAIAAAVRDQLAAALEPTWVALAGAVAELRPSIVRSGLPAEQRSDVLRSLASSEAAVAVATGGVAELRRWLRLRYPDLTL